MKRLSCLISAALLLAAPCLAEAPRVAADIAPVQGLVDRVMRGIGGAELIVRPGANPHGYALRPSQARALQEADLLVWIGPELTHWMSDPIRTLASDAVVLELLEVPGTTLHEFRDPDEADEDDDDHDHHGTDPHAWLDPVNAQVWLGTIAQELAQLDPDNADGYRANADQAKADLTQLTQDIRDQLAPMRDRPFVSFHDAYQYFEHRFGLQLAGTVAQGDGQDPSPAQLAHLRELIDGSDIACAFSEPQFNTALLHVALEGQDIPVIELDPLGAGLEPGPDFYTRLILAMGAGFAQCPQD